METLAVSSLSTEEEDLMHRRKKKSKVGAGPKEFFSRKVVSYKDVCLGVNVVDDGYVSSDREVNFWQEEDDGLEDEEPVAMEEVEEDNLKLLCPTVKLTKSERIGAYLDNDYFIIRFADWSDLSKVYEGGPWLIMGHYLVIQRWKPEFLPYEDEFKRVLVWIRIPGLQIEYYDDHILWRIGDVVGHTIKIDPNTLGQHEDDLGTSMVTEKARFARICVEVDLRKVLIARFKLHGRVYHVKYEGLHLICFKCGCFGHCKELCPLLEESLKTANQEDALHSEISLVDNRERDQVLPPCDPPQTVLVHPKNKGIMGSGSTETVSDNSMIGVREQSTTRRKAQDRDISLRKFKAEARGEKRSHTSSQSLHASTETPAMGLTSNGSDKQLHSKMD
ncbi:hypothetical protein SESBI_38230 [Sesbania bispinosa]|nr:hypothetical protein SESBI_38230 [Sesbania bispinosa]